MRRRLRFDVEGFGRDSVSAILEVEAVGQTAKIPADIRANMEIPLVTSI